MRAGVRHKGVCWDEGIRSDPEHGVADGTPELAQLDEVTEPRGLRRAGGQIMAYTRVGDLLLGLVALALLRGRLQDLGGEAFSNARVADLRRILDNWSDPALQSAASWHDAPAADGYATWAATYDDGGNPLIELDQATLGPLLARHPPGDALDAACGTGRWAAFLNERGHNLIGVDESPQTPSPVADIRTTDNSPPTRFGVARTFSCPASALYATSPARRVDCDRTTSISDANHAVQRST
jgi:hypothetical protein